MNGEKLDGVKEQLKGLVDLTLGKITRNKDRELQGGVAITNGSSKKERADWQDNVRKGADDPSNPSNE
jgi:uncharacterized protein YjbJ (UPF0337 family)